MTTASSVRPFKITENKIFIRAKNRLCQTQAELLDSELFLAVLRDFTEHLQKKNSPLLNIFPGAAVTDKEIVSLIKALKSMARIPGEHPKSKDVDFFLKDRMLFNDFVEQLYNHWRHFDRFMICDSEGEDYDQHPYRTFNDTIEAMTHLVRSTYRDIQENIVKKHPRIYRQVSSGANIAAIALPKEIPFPASIYKKLNKVPIVREVLIYPPLVLTPPMNKRKGRFKEISQNPLEKVDLNGYEWLCYPAKVGSLIIYIYFCEKFYELGLSLSNLFELADDKDLERKPDAVYVFGVPDVKKSDDDPLPTVFYEDKQNDILVGTVPDWDEFGYFGYVKKMALTLHNVKKMKSGIMPFHGALIDIHLKSGHKATVLSIGDTGAGKSETLEAFRQIGDELIQDIRVIADDMGSLEIGPDGRVLGFGTEIGAFLRLDDLQPGYAFGQIDRAIIMSPNKVNARIILPVTNFETVSKGHPIDYVFYANNYEEIDEDHPVIQKFSTPEEALNVFREGTVMSKGTTNTTGLVHSYFANVFGPAQFRELHDGIALKYFKALFSSNVFVGQMRTRLGISGWERKGPEEAARELIALIAK